MTPNSTDCPWPGTDPLYRSYHDQQWGRPIADSKELFAKLCLDGQQAGLSWITILKKTPHYEKVFYGFDPKKIISHAPKKFDHWLQDPGIVRNRLKIESIVKNARAYLAIQKEFGSFANFLWEYVDFKPIQNSYRHFQEIPAETPLSKQISKDLKKRGFNFVGPTIVYAFMQAVGMVNDHLITCSCHPLCVAEAQAFKL